MQTQKLSISIPKQQFDFIEDYQKTHHYTTRSDVIRDALRLLQQLELEASYKEANSEITHDFDSAIADGLDDNEAW